MRIGLSYDLKETIPLVQTGSDDALEEYDSLETVEIIAASIESAGHSVVKLGGGQQFLANILHEDVDLVFNIAEGRGVHRSREAQVPAVLEMLDIPYSGSDPQCLAICLDKPLTKKLVASAGVYTPQSRLITDIRDMRQIIDGAFPFPAMVKPAYEGSSKGVRLNSVVDSPEQAIEVVVGLLELYQQPVMIEEFIIGDEVTVGIINNSPPQVLGMMRVLPREKTPYFVYSIEVKRNYLEMVDYECPAALDEKVLRSIENASLNAFKALGCRDFARVDFRISPEGMPYFLEINPLPGLGTYSDLVIMAQMMKKTHQELICAVLNAALKRYPQCVRV
ncbi:MAG: D-alanine--D-alanine ligase [Chloroflexi bacterium]|nr:D-alanine--D-alanine ligase [Chloroflexota bacterium]